MRKVIVLVVLGLLVCVACKKKEEKVVNLPSRRTLDKSPENVSRSEILQTVMGLLKDEPMPDDLTKEFDLRLSQMPNPGMWQIVMVGQMHDAVRHKKTALDLYLRAAQKFPSAAEPWVGIGSICYDASIQYMVENNEFEQAKTGLIVMRPGDKAKDILVYAKGCFEKAKQKTTSFREEDGGGKTYLFDLEKSDEFIKMINSKLVYYWYSKGRTAEKGGQYLAALNCYDEVLALEPVDFFALYARGNVLFALSRYEDAITSFDKAILAKPTAIEVFNNREMTRMKIRNVPWPITEKSIEFLKGETRDADSKNRLGGYVVLYLASIRGDEFSRKAVEEITKETPEVVSEFGKLKIPIQPIQ